MTGDDLTVALRNEAARLGFCQSGACAAVEPPGLARFQAWLEGGYAGQMHYLSDRQDAYRHPDHVLEGVKSLFVLATDYRTVVPEERVSGQGLVSRYAWGLDYHDVLRRRLNLLADFHRGLTPDARIRGVVDTAPLMEREFAVLAGLGWIGKNTLLLTRQRGSWLFLSVLLTTERLTYDSPFAANHCGTCRACLDACPTGAFLEPYVLDARRCLSYLTIELKELPPPDLRGVSNEWVFGCDVCQDVCPWNRQPKADSHDIPVSEEFWPVDDETCLDLIRLFNMDEADFRARFRKTPLWRAKRRGLLRNAALILGNERPPGATEALYRGLDDGEPLVRLACAWALGQFSDPSCLKRLQKRLEIEDDPEVCREIRSVIR